MPFLAIFCNRKMHLLRNNLELIHLVNAKSERCDSFYGIYFFAGSKKPKSRTRTILSAARSIVEAFSERLSGPQRAWFSLDKLMVRARCRNAERS
jgi:hypothetical protein